MNLHRTTFEYLKPTGAQNLVMATTRERFGKFADEVEAALPEGADRDHVLRLIRTAAMWANVAITREADGTPRP